MHIRLYTMFYQESKVALLARRFYYINSIRLLLFYRFILCTLLFVVRYTLCTSFPGVFFSLVVVCWHRLRKSNAILRMKCEIVRQMLLELCTAYNRLELWILCTKCANECIYSDENSIRRLQLFCVHNFIKWHFTFYMEINSKAIAISIKLNNVWFDQHHCLIL